ncbi:MAG: PTPDL family protein [Luteolibacter sp.]|uniref:PTPDL family protein n=1 Tax=Luteolibacter sp. TaxID=1962973 RepID=UPI00326754A3
MKTNPALLALISLAVSLPAKADKFTLKDGTTLEATISSEDASNYVLEVQVTKSIRDERKVPKADVVKVERAQPDLKAFESIAKLVPTPDLLTDEEYGVRINAVMKFLKDYPAGDKAKDAKAMLATLKAESAQIASGGIKVNGSIVSPAEYKLNAYDLDARVAEASIRSLVAQGETLAALRAFSDFCKNFQSTSSFGSLSPLMQQVIKTHVAEAKESLSTLDARLKKRAAGLEQMSSEDRGITDSAIKEEDAAFEARLKSEKDAHQSWVTPSPFNKASLEETIRFGEAELVRLGSVKTALGQDGGRTWREAWAVIHNSGNPTAVSTAITNARTVGISPKYLAMLEEAAKVKK